MDSAQLRRRKKNQFDVDASVITEPVTRSDSSQSNFSKKNKDTTNFSTYSESLSLSSDYDEYAWFAIFLVGLSYFILTRNGGDHRMSNRGGLLARFTKPYEVVTSLITIGSIASDVDLVSDLKKDEELLKSIFYIADSTDKPVVSSKTSKILTLAPGHRMEIIITSNRDFYNVKNDKSGATDRICTHSDSCVPSFVNVSPPFLSHVLCTTWVHDPDLGRGYLLIADGGRSGRIWRWEVGGGPITIGRSLHMERSGCRSGLWIAARDEANNAMCPENLFGNHHNKLVEFVTWSGTSKEELETPSPLPPLLGSASIVVELTRDAVKATSGKNFLVAEWGEKRIVRVEGETGARTPLVTMVPVSINDRNGSRRVNRPNHLTYTPFGDLLFSDNYEQLDEAIVGSHTSVSRHVGIIYRLKEAVHVPPIPVEKSREAHGWTGTTGPSVENDDTKFDIIFQADGWVDGMALGGLDFSTLFLSVITFSEDESQVGWTRSLFKVTLDVDDADTNEQELYSREAAYTHEKLFTVTCDECQDCDRLDKSSHYSVGSRLAINEQGIIHVAACPSSVILISQDGHAIGHMTLDDLHLDTSLSITTKESVSREITSVNFGEDGYFYVSTPHEVLRIQCRINGLKVPTNLVVPPPIKSWS